VCRHDAYPQFSSPRIPDPPTPPPARAQPPRCPTCKWTGHHLAVDHGKFPRWLKHKHSCKHKGNKCNCTCEYVDAHKCGAGKDPTNGVCDDNLHAKQLRKEKRWDDYRQAFNLQPIAKDTRKTAQIICGGRAGSKEVVRCFSWGHTTSQKAIMHMRKSLRTAGKAHLVKFCKGKLAKELGSEFQLTEHILTDRFMNTECDNYAAMASKVSWETRSKFIQDRAFAVGKAFNQAFQDAAVSSKVPARRLITANDDGTNDDGTATNDDGSSTNDDGSSTNDDGSSTNDDGSSTNDDGTTTNDDGTTTNDDGSSTNDDGSSSSSSSSSTSCGSDDDSTACQAKAKLQSLLNTATTNLKGKVETMICTMSEDSSINQLVIHPRHACACSTCH
jgi:hypothetical protein